MLVVVVVGKSSGGGGSGTGSEQHDARTPPEERRLQVISLFKPGNALLVALHKGGLVASVVAGVAVVAIGVVLLRKDDAPEPIGGIPGGIVVHGVVVLVAGSTRTDVTVTVALLLSLTGGVVVVVVVGNVPPLVRVSVLRGRRVEEQSGHRGALQPLRPRFGFGCYGW